MLGNLFPDVKNTAVSFIRMMAGEPVNGIDAPKVEDNSEIDWNDPEIEIYNIQGMRVPNPTSGIYICRKGNKAKKFILK